MIAYGTNDDGRREILGFSAYRNESRETWKDNTGNAVSGRHRQIEHFKHFRHPYVSSAVQMAARFFAESTGQMRFPRAGKTVDDNVMAGVDKGVRSKSQYRVSIQTPVLIVHRVDICLRITKFGVTEKPFCPVCALVCVTDIDQKIQTVIEAHVQKSAEAVFLVVERIYHAVQLQFTKFSPGFFTDHPDRLLRNSWRRAHMRHLYFPTVKSSFRPERFSAHGE